ncbi:MAG: hypothetical protein KF781_08560 [Chitinophagaceae bacterium]|nr:hypothetical protein [Chitinophagaceae bacterium]
MGQKSIIFSGVVCYVNNEQANIQLFQDTLKQNDVIFQGDRVHSYQFEFINNYLKISFSDGSAKPRNPNVFNVKTHEQEPNPRQADQAEPKEFFGVLDFSNSYLWLSNTQKKTMITDYFKNTFQTQQIVLKDVYDEAKFIETLKVLDAVKISAAPNLFSETNTLSKALSEEMHGAYEATLDLKYNNVVIKDNILTWIKSIFGNKNNFKKIVIAGRDEKNLGILFNNNLFSRKIEFKAEVDENEMFSPNDVFTKLISKIEEEINAEK